MKVYSKELQVFYHSAKAKVITDLVVGMSKQFASLDAKRFNPKSN